MGKTGMNRRQFLQTSRAAAAGTAAAIGAGRILIDPKGAWAMSMKALDPHSALTLVGMSREVYPHDHVGDVHYARVVEGLDGKASVDPAFGRLLTDGVADLDASQGGVRWLDLSAGYRLEALERIEDTPFFQAVRGEIVTGLYNNPDVWRLFGYEGASADFGGYLERGFNDIGWLRDA